RTLTIPVSVVSKEDKSLSITFLESNKIGKFYVFSGKEFDYDTDGIWLDNFYCINNDLKVGDKISFTYDDYTFEKKIVGIINAPDHLYDVKDSSELYPDHENFGFAFISSKYFPSDYIKKMVMKEAGIDNEEFFDSIKPDFNYLDYIPYTTVKVDLKDDSKRTDTKLELESIDAVKAVIDIEDTSSYATYQGEIEEGETYIGIFSGLFLFIAILSVITTMTRVIKKQRVQIGTLKALGFSKWKINTHYIGYGFWLALVASILGLIVGRYFIGNVFIGMEMSFFSMPNGVPVLTYDSYLVAIGVVLVVSFVTYVTCRNELKENPSESLRVQMPKVKEGSLDITNKGIFKKLKFASKWNLRDILRNKIRTITGVVGVAACCLLIVCALGMLDSMNNFLDLQFSRLYNFDYKLNLKSGLNNDQVKELTDQYGDSTSETIMIEIVKDKKRFSNMIFVTDAGNKVRFVDQKQKYTKVDCNDGVYVTYKLAENEGYKLGDTLTWRIYGTDNYYQSKIVGFTKDPQNQILTCTREYLEKEKISYQPDSLYTNKDLSKVKTIKNVELIQD
ncbi:MAG: ABC transporter permease, partial [Bacilli bacterium]|nr:ABC transporter permease [Bacilli bacterium]